MRKIIKPTGKSSTPRVVLIKGQKVRMGSLEGVVSSAGEQQSIIRWKRSSDLRDPEQVVPNHWVEIIE